MNFEISAKISFSIALNILVVLSIYYAMNAELIGLVIACMAASGLIWMLCAWNVHEDLPRHHVTAENKKEIAALLAEERKAIMGE